MCEFCEKEKVMISKETISRSNWGWGYDNVVKITLIEAEESPTILDMFIDRGFIRLVDRDDCNCIESGEKIKINFCPMCGDKII